MVEVKKMLHHDQAVIDLLDGLQLNCIVVIGIESHKIEFKLTSIKTFKKGIWFAASNSNEQNLHPAE